MEIVSDCQMREEESTTPARSLEVSISFGRFEKDLLSWEKWSSFSQNKYLEEVEKCATPGSVAAKKAYFEARNKLIAVRKEMLSKQTEVCQEMKDENDFQNTCASEVNQHDEEVIDENLCGSELSSPGVNEHTEEETNMFMSQEPDTKDAIEATSTKQLTTGGTIYRSEMSYPGMNEQPEVETNILMSQETDGKDVIEAVSTIQLLNGETIIGRETSCPLVVDFRKKDLFMPESKMLNKDNTDGITRGSNSDFDIYDAWNSIGRVQEEQIFKLRCETDQPINIQRFFLGTAQTDEKEPVEHPFGNDAPEDTEAEAILKIAVSPYMLDQFKVDDAEPIKSPSPTEGDFVAEDIPAFKTEKLNAESACVGELPEISATKNAQTLKLNPRLQNSSKKIFPANKQKSADKVKKILDSSVPGSPQMLTPKTSYTSVPTFKSASRSLPASKVKRTPASAPAVRKSEQIPNATRSTLDFPVSALKSSSLSKKGPDLLSSREKIITPVVSQKPIPKSLHTSLNFGSKVSSSILGSTPFSEPIKSLFLEKMGDKDIVKRAFRAFQYMSNPPNIDSNATSKKVVRDKIHKTDVMTSTPHLQKEKDRLIKKIEVDVRSKKSATIYTSGKLTHSNEDKRKEVKKIAEKIGQLSNYKEGKVTGTANRRQSLTNKAATRSGLHKRQGLSKSFQDTMQDAPKS